MEQCTCKCKTCESKQEEPVVEEKPKIEPHNRLHRKSIYAFKGQEKEDVAKLLRQAEKQEKSRLKFLLEDHADNSPSDLFENDISPLAGMPILKREPVATVNVGGTDDDGEEDYDRESEFGFMMQKLAGLDDREVPDYRNTVSVKENVVKVLSGKYCGKMQFEWSSDEDSYLEQFLLVNNAKTKISISPLVEIFNAVSKISDEDDAMNMTCQVVISKLSSLFE